MDIIEGLIETGSATGSDWHITNNNGEYEIVNTTSGNLLFTILNDGTIGTGPNYTNDFVNNYNGNYGNVNIVTNYGSYSYTSNYVLSTSNKLMQKIIEIDNKTIGDSSNSIQFTSNYILSTSNNLIQKINENYIISSNYILSTSNNLINKINYNSVWIPTTSNIYYYSTGNIGIGTNAPNNKLHIYNESLDPYDMKLTIQNNYIGPLTNNIIDTGASDATTTLIGSDFCTVFPYSGSSTNTSYNFTLPRNTICDILIIGGGGSGGGNKGGGGGAGGYIYLTGQTLTSGSYTVTVGKGGIGTLLQNTSGNNSSLIKTDNAISYIAAGGGRGATKSLTNINWVTITEAPVNTRTAEPGGSGGGGIVNYGAYGPFDQSQYVLGASIQNSTYGIGVGFNGGQGSAQSSEGFNIPIYLYASGGGGGAGGVGGNPTLTVEVDPTNRQGIGGNGGDGVSNNITGSLVIYCAGGGGGGFDFYNGVGGSSGNGSFGSGGNYGAATQGGANGQNGIVIIRYARILFPFASSIELLRGISSDSNTDYKIGNYNGDFKIMSSTSNVDTNILYLTSNGNITVSGNITATNIIGNGSNITDLNMNNSTGILSVARGGTGATTLTAGQLLIGNTTSALLQTPNLTWDAVNNRLGIGTTEPAEPLHVVGNIVCTGTVSGDGSNITALNMANASTGTLAVARGGTGATTLTAGQLLIGNTTSALLQTPNLTWDAVNNRLGIGTTEPAEPLHVVGNIVCTGTVSGSYSDDRLKTRTSDIKEPLEIIDRLNGFYYIPNALAYSKGITDSNQEIGLSAQDVQKVLPELVNIAPFDLGKDKDNNKISKSGENYLTISYERLAPVFVEAFKELKKENCLLNEKYENILQDITLLKQKLI